MRTRVLLWRRRRALRRLPAAGDTLGLPPPRLRARVTGNTDVDDFLTTGARHASALAELAAGHGVPFAPGVTVADIGCGCGRVLRHWVDTGARLLASDPERDLEDWVLASLPVGALDGGPVDVVVAYSVLTHLPVDGQRSCLATWAGLLRPGGLLLCSTHGRSRRLELTLAERRRFDAGEVVVRHPAAAGDNLCSAFVPPEAAPALFAPLRLVDHREPPPAQPWDQDLWVLAP